MTAHPTALHSFRSSVNMLTVHSAPSTRSLMKIFNSVGINIDTCSVPSVTDFQMDFEMLVLTL